MVIKRILVTGSEGYIGSVLLPLLVNKGYDVAGIDCCYFCEQPRQQPRLYKLIVKDVRDLEIDDLSGFDALVHLAALSNDPMGELSADLTDAINYQASVRLAELSKKAGIKRFLFSSSCSVYGKTEDSMVDENSPVAPITAYAKSKLLAENELIRMGRDVFSVGILRNSTVYGWSPAFRSDLVVNDFTACAYATGKIKVHSDGTPWRPLIDVRDLSNVFINFLEADSKIINNQVYAVGFNNGNLQIKMILDTVHKVLPSSKIVYTGLHGSDSRSYQVDFSKLKANLSGLKSEWTLSDSINDIVRELKQTGFSSNMYEQGKYVRLKKLKLLLEKGELTEKLRWKTPTK